MKFADLKIGDRFMFTSGINDGPWTKLSPRRYDNDKIICTIGTTKCEVVKMEEIKKHRIVYTRHQCYLGVGVNPIVIMVCTDKADPDALFLNFKDSDVAKQLGFTEENLSRTYKVPGETNTIKAREAACRGHFLQVGIRVVHVTTSEV